MFTRYKSIKYRRFYCELKNRPSDDKTGEREELVDILEIFIPKIKDSQLEQQWAFVEIWNKLYLPEFAEKGINQVFIFTAEGRELIARVETTPFEDEPSHKMSPPDETNYNAWSKKLNAKFKQVYGISIKEASLSVPEIEKAP